MLQYLSRLQLHRYVLPLRTASPPRIVVSPPTASISCLLPSSRFRFATTMAARPQENGRSTGSTSNGPTQIGNFKLLQSFSLPYAPEMSVQKWKSEKTGLTLVWADFQSPLLNAYMTVPTEIFNDSGVPHTLEHLIFLGSNAYPYKGILDSLANRAFASGTNAWTANDHTAYTITTASSDGFLRMLPVYADHLFRPTITDAGFTTEVYHINGKGEDAGVVYSEMQGRENTSGDLMELRMQRSLYPTGNAYRSETGGLMEKLRVLTAQEIRDYHGQYYAPHNVALVITGPLPQEGLLEAVNSIDEALISAGKAPGPSGPKGWSRPFLTTPSAVPPTIDGTEAGDHPSLFPVDADDKTPRDRLRRKTTIEFPEEDESVGEVYLTWVGSHRSQWLEQEALGIIDTYLTDSAVSPLQSHFVERDDPLCTDIYLSSETGAGRSTLSAYFSSVPTDRLETLDQELLSVLSKIVTDGIDMERMHLCIQRDRIKLLNELETKPAESFADVLIEDHLYGEPEGKDLPKSMDDMTRFDQLKGWSSDQWTALIQKYYIDNPRLLVIGKPSKAMVKRLKKETKELESKRKAELGEEGLKRYNDALEAARAENDRPIPPEILNGFKIPSESSIAWIQTGQKLVGPRPQTGSKQRTSTTGHTTTTALDEKLQRHLAQEQDIKPIYPIQVVQVPSAFVSLSLVFPTTDLEPSLRPLMQLYLSTFFSLPLKQEDGTTLPYEAVVKGLDEDCLEYDAAMGVGSIFPENVCIEIKVEKAKYPLVVKWLRDLVWRSVFSLERLKVSAAKTTQSLPELKRDGNRIASALSRSLTHENDKSTNTSTNVLSMLKFMPILNADLAKDPQGVVNRLETIRKTVFRPENMLAAIMGDVCSLDKPIGTLVDAFAKAESVAPSPSSSLRIPWANEVLTDLGRQPSKTGVICSLPTLESSFALFSCKGPVGFDVDADVSARAVTVAMMNALEAPLWRYIRGAGLAYGASISINAEVGLCNFSLYRSPDSSKAYKEAKKVMEALANNGVTSTGEVLPGLQLDQTSLDSAKSLLHFNVADAEGTVSQSAWEVVVDETLKGVGRGGGRLLLQKVKDVTLEDCQRVLKEWILPIFNAETSVVAVACGPGKVEDIKKELEGCGYEMERRDLDFGNEEEEGESEGSESGSSEESGGTSSSGEEDTDMKD